MLRSISTSISTSILVKNNTATEERGIPFCYVDVSQVRIMTRAKQSFLSDKETRNFYMPRKVIAIASMLQEKDKSNQEDCVETLVCTPFFVRTF
jgi:hypothetical protein